MKYILFFLTLLAGSAFGEVDKSLEFYPVLNDFDVPSINVGMFIERGKGKSDKEAFLIEKKKAIARFEKRSFFGLIGKRLEKLKIQKFETKGHEECCSYQKNFDLRILFEPVSGTPALVLTKDIGIKDVVDYIKSKHKINEQVKKNTVRALKNKEYITYSKIRFRKGQVNSWMARSIFIEGEYYLQEESESEKKKFDKYRLIKIPSIIDKYEHSNITILDFSKGGTGTKGIFNKGRLISIVTNSYKDIKFRSKIVTEVGTYYLFDYIHWFGPEGRRVYILKEKNDKFQHVISSGLLDFAEFHWQ